ncbi:MAG: hypothetical protein HY898_31805 [Deltaproteobacteria bacterium]|nr:hypothetical protein [Deltaproteobacteria bacterium]
MRPSELVRPVQIAAAMLASALAVRCSQTPVSVPVRSLEQSGRAAFLCLSPDLDNVSAPIDACNLNAPTYGYNHLYSLVTQTARGEVALIDLTAASVVDLDPAEPGYNFIPVGAQPVDIVATPGGTAAFVGSGEPNKYAIYVLPMARVLEGSPHLTDFAACALPTPPGRMLMLNQPLAEGGGQQTCDGTAHDGVPHPNGNLGAETVPPGTRKLLVTLPDQGDVAIIDAQELLDSAPGTLTACKIERMIHLKVDLPATLPQQRTPEGGFPPGQSETGGVCELTLPQTAATQSGFKAHPIHLSHDPETGLLYIADDAAPVIHVVDVADPCSPVERPPLLPMSVSDPWRVVYTREIAVSSTTTAGKKYLYAIDHREGSMMVFDVSLGSTDRTPLLRPYPDRNPFQSRDRLAFAVPIKSLVFMLRDPSPLADLTTGAAPAGVICDPDSTSSALGTSYRTSVDWASGASPKKLRGVYAAAVLTNGQIVFVDVDDFDAPCRRPKEKDACTNETAPNYQGANGELSCKVIEPHQSRSAYYLENGNVPGARMPGMQTYPILTRDSTTLAFDDPQPKLLVPQLIDKPGIVKVVQVGGSPAESIESDPASALHNMVWFDLREPRVHYDQDWTVTYEGQIPGFAGHVARLLPNEQRVQDAGAYFCDRGVHDFDAAIRVANSIGHNGSAAEPTSPAYIWARAHVDVVQITDGIRDPEDTYWTDPLGTCSYEQCKDKYGPADSPRAEREFPILEAYQDHLVVDGDLNNAWCCFPMVPTYTVRPRAQWIVNGTVSGFLHKVAVDSATARCIESCDPSLRLRNGRVIEGARVTQAADIPKIDAPGTFRNPMIQFWIQPGAQGHGTGDRDMVFSFSSNGGFVPLVVNLGASTSYVQPQSVTYVPQLGQLAIADGSVQGLMMVDLVGLTLATSYY